MAGHVCLTQVRARDLRRLLCLLYNGYADVTLEAAAELKEVWKHLDINIVEYEPPPAPLLTSCPRLKQPQIDVVDQADLAAKGLGKDGRHFTEPLPAKQEQGVTLQETSPARVKQERGREMEDPDEDPDDPSFEPTPLPVKKLRGPASKRKALAPDSATVSPLGAAKKVRAEGGGTYFVEEVHVCKLCHGKDQNGKVDKDGLNLSFRELKKLVGHYGKHLYDEGKVFKYVPLGPDNVDKGQGIDEFGKTFRYKCGIKSCWKFVKGECGYKEFALHMISDHEALEQVLKDDPRPELQDLLGQIVQVKKQQLEAMAPKFCLMPDCEAKDKPHAKDNDYRSLKQHYAVAHCRRWFERPTAAGQQPRTQKLTKTGAHCLVCNLKMFGDDAKMIEHYSVVHGRLQEALMDVESPVVTVAETRLVLGQLFPDLLKDFQKKSGPGGKMK